MSKAGILRLQKEYKAILKEKPENIEARPSPQDILKWHYVIRGPSDSPYAGGVYHGILQFPKGYPFKPPRITMRTPNGRFAPDTRLCLSMSDFHPESWNPLWKVSTILAGLLSFMLEDEITNGSITSSSEVKRRYARDSLAFNLQDPVFRKLFPHYIEEQATRLKESRSRTLVKQEADSPASASSLQELRSTDRSRSKRKDQSPGIPPGLMSPKANRSASRLLDDRNIDRLIIMVMILVLGFLFKQLY